MHAQNQLTVELEADHCRVYVRNRPPGFIVAQVDAVLRYCRQADAYVARRRGYPVPVRTLFDWATLSFPSGLLHRVQRRLEELGCRVVVRQTVPVPALRSYSLPDWLYPHQVQAVRHLLQHPHSTVQSPTGSGKTVVAAVLLAHLEGRGLVVVPTQDLLQQTKARLENILGEPVGQVGAGKRAWERITVGIINSLVAGDGPYDEIEAVVYDEAHRAVQVSRYGQLSERLTRAYYRWGLTAGAHRQDGLDLAMEAVIGPTLLVISERETERLGLTVKPQVYFVSVPDPRYVYTGAVRRGEQVTYPTENGKPDLDEVYEKAVVTYGLRNQYIQRVVQAYRARHRQPVLVLVEAIRHGELLSELLAAPFAHGGLSRRERQSCLEWLRGGNVLVASRIYNEGIDLPGLGLVVNAGCERSRQQTRQKVGRVVRAAPGKQAIYVDFADREPYYLASRARQRLQVLETIYPNAVRIVDIDDLCMRL